MDFTRECLQRVFAKWHTLVCQFTGFQLNVIVVSFVSNNLQSEHVHSLNSVKKVLSF